MLKKRGLKWTLSIMNRSTLVITITEWPLNFIKNDGQFRQEVNEYHINTQYDWDVKECLLEIKEAMMVGNWNNSDLMSDYFDVGWYIDINIWTYRKPYILTKG